jgi:sec-independent protein translocase protein TatA
MPSFGPGELIIILIIALIVIGPGRLPDVGSALGKSIREFRKASSDVQEATRVDSASPAAPPAATPPASSPPPASPSEASTEPRS